MEEDRTFQYTQFPNLTAINQPSPTRACLQIHWQRRFLSLPDEVLILGWASLLQAYTRVSVPVFSLNGHPICVDVSQKRWRNVQVHESLEGAGSPSYLTLLPGGGDAIHNKESKAVSLADAIPLSTFPTPLSFQYDSRTGHGLLSSSGSVPESFLGELERQLTYIVISELPQGREKVLQSSTAPSPSVLNAQRKSLDGPLFLHELISKNWQKTSTAIDFLDGDGDHVQISYARLNHLTDSLARRIASLLAPGSAPPSQVIVPVYLPQSPDLYCACIAILKANAAFCPLSMDMPDERIKYILEDIGARVVLTVPMFTPKIRQVRPSIQVIEVQAVHGEDGSVIGYDSPFEPPKMPSPDSLAYVMYTSGSTGVPKGVAIPHAAVTQALLAHDEHVPKFDRFLQFAAPTFDVSVFETFFPLFRGATLVTRHREHMLGDLAGTLRELSIDAAELTPTVAGTLLRKRDAAPCLRLLLTIGEMLTRNVMEEFAERPGSQGILLPMYGPTEASIHCTLAPSVTTTTKVGIIGRPLSTVTTLIIQEAEEASNADMEVLPIGQVGELAVAGQLATGYLNRDVQTKASFRHHPKYGRIYRTGDRARLLPNGDLECLGRISSGQVKIRGQRVELGEIEQVVCKVDGIQSAAVSIIDDIIVAFCITSSRDASREQVMFVCKSWLPSFMRPGDIVLLDGKVPRLASGKINKKQLEADYRAQLQATANAQDGSQSRLEHQIIRAIEVELSKKISPSDNLWSHGLDSLRAIKLSSRFLDEGIWLSVSDILEAENISALAERLWTGESAGTRPAGPQIEASIWDPDMVAEAALQSLSSDFDTSQIETFRPCSPLQVAMLVETSTNGSLNFNSIKVQLPDHVSIASLCEAFQLVACHNKILRSGFVRTNAPQQPFCQIVWKRLDVEGQGPVAVSRGQLDKADTLECALLHPLSLHFAETRNGRFCTIHIHHALYDGWSFELILQDVERVICGQGLPQRPQFDDILVYQLRRRLEPASDAARTYWQDHLRDIRPATFPKLRTKEVPSSGRQAFTQAFTLDLQGLTSTCQTLRVSRQSLVSAAFAILLSSYIGNTNIVFGAVSSGRTMPIPGIERIIGPCINTFPMRLDSSKLRTIRDVINSTHRQYHNVLQYDEMTLSDIKILSGTMVGDSLFDSLFVWQEGPGGLQSSGRVLNIVESSDSLNYAVALEAEPRDGKVLAKMSFLPATVSASHAMLFLNQLDSLLTIFARSPETLVRDCYRSMKKEELSIENADFGTFNQKFTLTSTIDRLANEDPSRTAIEFVDAFDSPSGQLETTTISYGELYRRSSHISQSLTAKGVSPDSVVSIVMEKSVELYVAILGVVRSGAAYLAIDPRTPADRVRKILDDSRCRLVISEDPFRGSVGSQQLYSTSELESVLEDTSPTFCPYIDRHEDNLAYVVYTSGSTGVPKGVLITRSNVLSNINCLSKLYPSNPDSKLLQACSPAFDVSVFEIFFTWHMGMSLCAAPTDILFRDIEHLIRRTNVSHLSLTPSVAALIEPDNVPSVKFLVTAGEPMNSKVFNSWIERGLYQGYGPSETTNICNLRPQVTLGDFPNNVGPPLPNTSNFICQGESFSLVPRGAVGEIWIGGDQVGRGYLCNDDLTNKRFISHATYGRLYRSGDIGRILSDGSLVVVGRDDDQVKLRGHRIELGDINQTIVSSVMVKDAATLILHTPSSDVTRLVSFWIPTLAASESTYQADTQSRAIHTDLEAKLPAYMIPDILMPINHIPLTSQGKIDKGMLIKQFEGCEQSLLQCLSRANIQQEDNGALSQHEAAITKTIADVVGRHPSAIHRDASFFAIGLDSIKSITVSQRLRNFGFCQVDISTILRHASVKRLATYLSSSAYPSGPDLIRVPRQTTAEKVVDDGWQRHAKAHFASLGYNIAKFLPCTPLQEAMLSSFEFHRRDSYQNTLVFRVNGDLAELKRSWKAMLSRHQLLRTGFAMTSSFASTYAQVVLENYPLPWSWVSTPPGHDLGEQLHDGCMLPPYFLEETRDGDGGSATLTLRMHHALYDGEAMNLLLREVEMHYLGKRLPPIVPFDCYLEYMLSLVPTSIDNFWSSQLNGYTSRLVTEVFRPTIQGDMSARFTASHVSRVPFSTLKGELQCMSTTLLALLQTSWARLLSFYLRTFDVCFGNVYSGRSIPVQDADYIIGPCFNTLPVRVELQKLQTTAELSRRLQENNTLILPYQPSSLRRILRQHGGIERPLFDTLLLLQPEEQPLNSRIWTLVDEAGDMNFPIICETIPDVVNNRLRLRLHLQGGQVSVPEAHRLLENFDTLLQNDLQFSQGASRDLSILKDKSPVLLRNPTIEASSPLSFIPNQLEHSAEEIFSDLEKKIRQLLSEASETDITKIKKHTSIFQLGLDSINAVQIAAKLRREGFNVTGGDILEASSIAGIKDLCSARSACARKHNLSFDLAAFDAKHRSRVCEAIRVPPSSIEAVLPCTATQSGILAEFVRSDGHFYVNSLTLRLSTFVDVNLLKEAWTQAISRHEMLRTGFAEIEGAEPPFAMITYRAGIYQLPWSESSKMKGAVGSDVDGRRIWKLLHQPLWCLLYVRQPGNCHLQLSILHALYDAHSLDLILADVASLYCGANLAPQEGIRHSLSSILSESMIQVQESESFFKELGKSLQPTRFPDLRIYSHEIDDVSLVIQPCARSQHELRQGCKQAGMSLQTAIQCAWAQLLAAYTGHPDVTFGVIFSGRSPDSRKDSIAFPMINMLPMPLHVGECAADLARQASKVNAALMRRQFVPLTQIKKWLGVKESLFDTVIVLQQYPSSKDGITIWDVVADNARTEHAVSLEVVPDAQDTVILHLTFRQNVLPSKQADILLGQFETLLYTIIFPAQTGEEFHIQRTPELFSITPAKLGRIATSTRLLHEMVELSAQSWPERIAFEFATSISDQGVSKQCWSYKSLDGEANKIAHLLIEHGAVPGDMIGICFEKCPEASFAILGILKAGCAFVAIDPNAPEARKDFIIRDSGCKVFLCLRDQIKPFERVKKLQALALDDMVNFPRTSSGRPQLSRKLMPEDTCYCLYTSGTTGQPKGCLISHDNAVQALLCFQRIFAGHWNDDSRWLQFASFHFDVSVLEQFWSWSVGICVSSAPRDLLFEDLPSAIRALQITHLDLTPSLARLLKPDEVPSLCRGVFITGGEQLRQDVLDIWGDVGVLYNFYGPSEVTIGCTVHKQVPKSAKPSNIGQQFDNVGAFVLDLQKRRPVFRGATGELCLSGPLVGKGYLNRPELTETRFQYLSEFGVRIYRTGDLVRLLHDGSFEFLGRSDDQVKLRGQRLEIGEINHVLGQADCDLRDVATMVIRHPKQTSEQVVSFLSWSERSTRSANPLMSHGNKIKSRVAAIRQICESKLPGYMVPTYLIPVSLMPLSANNKADLNVLKVLFASATVEDLQRVQSVPDSDFSADQSSINKIIDLLSRKLGLNTADVRPWSSLFELGLDSISVIPFSRSLKDAGFHAASPSLVMRHSTVARLAIALRATSELSCSLERVTHDASDRVASFAKRHRNHITQILGVRDDSIEKIAPCTPLQEGMISKTLQTDLPTYAPTFIYDLSSDVDLYRLQNAWLSVQSETDILRTKFVATDDGFAQVVLKISTTQKCFVLNHKDEDDDDESGLDLRSWYGSVKSLESMPWRVILKKGRQGQVMVIHMFHALFDGISLPLLLEKVAQNYLGHKFEIVEPNFHEILPFGPLRLAEGAKAFWQEGLASGALSRLDLPVRHVRSADRDSSVKTINIRPSGGLDQLRLRLKVTMPALFQACWLLVLQTHFGTLPALGVVVSGRNIDMEGAENVIGPMFNTLPCLIEFRGNLCASDLVEACHKFNIDSLPFQHSALRDISKWIGHDLSQPLFDALFVFQKEASGLVTSSKLWTARESISEPDLPLAAEVQHNLDNSFNVTVAAHPQYLDTEEVHAILASFEDTLYKMLQKPDRPLPVYKRAPHLRDARTSAPANVSPSATPFTWTPEAKLIQQEVAGLANAKTEAIRANTTIFQLGLDSIDAIKLSARLKAVGVSITVGEMMRAGNIAAMAEASVRNSTTIAQKPSRPDYDRAVAELKQSLRSQGVAVDKYEKVLPATPLQEGMLANFDEYCSHDVLQLQPDVDVRKLRIAWENVIFASPILRTSFVEVRDPKLTTAYAQLVHGVNSVHEISRLINWCELSIVTESGLDGVVSKQRLRMTERGLQRPTLDLSFVSVNSRNFLVLGMAHALYDGWSVSMLHQDVGRWYSGIEVERPPYEPALRDMLEDENGSSHQFWKNRLSQLSPSLLPGYSVTSSTSTVTLRDEIPSQYTAESVQDFCKAHGITVQALGLTCCSVVLAGLFKHLDVCVGLVLSGRTTQGFDELMFPTMNTVVFSTTVQGRRRDMLKCVHDRIIEISEHQFFPLRAAKALCAVEGALFDALFIYQKRPQTDQRYPQLYQSIQTSSAVEYPVNVEMELDGTSLLWRAACKSTALNKEAVTQMVVDLDRALHELMRDPSEPVAEAVGENNIKLCGICTIECPQERPSTPPRTKQPSEALSLESVADWSPLETAIREVLACVSGFPREHISKKTSLFSLGLDSINSIKVSLMLREKSISLPVSVMLSASTIDNMAAAATQVTLVRPVSQRPDPEDGHPVIALSDYREALKYLEDTGVAPEGVENIMPVTAGQDYALGMWLASGERLFYSDFSYRITDPGLTVEKLEDAWTETVQKLPILRTTFIIQQGRSILQVPMNPDRDFTKRKDRSMAIPVRLLTTRSSSGLHIKLSIHHALYDAVSLSVIISTLEKFCGSNSKAMNAAPQINQHERRASSLCTDPFEWEQSVHKLDESTIRSLGEDSSTTAPSSLALKEFIGATRSRAAIQTAQSFWISYLAAEKDLPTNQPLAGFTAPRVEHYRPRLLGNVAEAEKIARDNGLSFHSLFLAACAFSHACLTSPGRINRRLSETVTVGVYLANRSLDIEGLLQLAHPTFNVVPLRTKLSGNIFDVAKNIQDDLGRMGQIPHCGVSLREIYEWTGVRIDCCVNFLKFPLAEKGDGESRQKPYFEPVARSSGEKDVSASPPPFTGSTTSATSDAFLPSIDIEAGIRDGGLDVGVFGPADLLNDQGALNVLDKLQSWLSTSSLMAQPEST